MSLRIDDGDPLAFVRGVLEQVPDDPAEASSDDFDLLAAAQAGLTEHVARAHAQMRPLARRLLAGDVCSEDALDAEWFGALTTRCERADHALETYCARAAAARGIDLDRLIAGDNERE